MEKIKIRLGGTSYEAWKRWEELPEAEKMRMILQSWSTVRVVGVGIPVIGQDKNLNG